MRDSGMTSYLSQLFVFTLALTLAPGAFAATSFSAAISGYHTGGCGFLAFPLYTPSLEWAISPGGSTVPRFSDDIQTIDSADGENVFGILRTSNAGLRIVRVMLGDAPLHNAREDFFDGLPGYYGGALAVAKSGRVFAKVSVPGPLNAHLAVISSAGSLERLLDLPISTGNLAVGNDGCTIYYADGVFIRRLNACTDVSLPLFSNFGQTVTDLAVLSTGNVLVLTERSLVELSGDGTLVRTFAVQGLNPIEYQLNAVSVSSDEAVVAIAAMRGCESRGQIIALAFADGRELWRQETSYISTATGLVVGAGAAAAIPTLSGTVFLLLAATLAAIALSVIRH
jgi:outer membrane protein assembly factor BamB